MSVALIKNDNRKRVTIEGLKSNLKSDLSFIDDLANQGFLRLSNGKIAYKLDDEMFDDEEDDLWGSYLTDKNQTKG